MSGVRDAQVRVQVGVREAMQHARIQRRVTGGRARPPHANILKPAQRPRRVQAPRQRQERVAVIVLHTHTHHTLRYNTYKQHFFHIYKVNETA